MDQGSEVLDGVCSLLEIVAELCDNPHQAATIVIDPYVPPSGQRPVEEI